MKHLTILIIVVLIASNAFSQGYNNFAYNYYDYTWYYNPYSPVRKEDVLKNNISEYTISKMNYKKPSKGFIITQQCSYNSKGLTSKICYYGNGKLNKQYTYTYNDSGKINSIYVTNSKLKCVNHYLYTYNSLNKVVKYESFKKDETEPSFYALSEYDSNRILRNDTYQKGKLSRSNRYTYYPDHSLEKTQIYNRKGKLVHTTSYACRPEGEKTFTHKDTTTICDFKERDSSGNFLEIRQYTDEKNKIRKYVYVYNPDTLFIESRNYNKNDILTNRFVYLPQKKSRNKSAQLLEGYRYNSKGKLIYKWFNTFDSDLHLIESSYNEIKCCKTKTSFTKYTYNEKGLLISTENIQNNKTKSTSKYEYKYGNQ